MSGASGTEWGGDRWSSCYPGPKRLGLSGHTKPFEQVAFMPRLRLPGCRRLLSNLPGQPRGEHIAVQWQEALGLKGASWGLTEQANSLQTGLQLSEQPAWLD